jgi:parvulin-like peptidyl-prolyl isomerase
MDVTTPSAEARNSTGASSPVRRAAVRRTTKTKRNLLSYLPFCGLLAAALIVGSALSAFVVRQRYHAQAVVVSVNGTLINKDYLFSRLQTVSGNAVMHQIINEEILLQYAHQQHLDPTEAQVNAEWQQVKTRAGAAQAIAASSPEEMKRVIRLQLIQTNLLSRHVTVTPEEVQAFYRAQTDKRNPNAQFYTPETATIAVIQTPTEAAARAALHDLTAGVAFDIVARKYSKDPSRQNGGLLPPIRRGQVRKEHPDLAAAIFDMKIGQQIGPIKLANVWWIIRCLDKTAEVTQPFDSVQEQCRRGASLVKGVPINKTSSMQDFTGFKQKANVQAFWPNYAEAVRTR